MTDPRGRRGYVPPTFFPETTPDPTKGSTVSNTIKRKKRVVVYEELEIVLPADGTILESAINEIRSIVSEMGVTMPLHELLREHVTVTIASPTALTVALNLSRTDDGTPAPVATRAAGGRGATPRPPTTPSNPKVASVPTTRAAQVVEPEPMPRTESTIGETIYSGTNCSTCKKPYDECTKQVMARSKGARNGKACCSTCGHTDTHRVRPEGPAPAPVVPPFPPTSRTASRKPELTVQAAHLLLREAPSGTYYFRLPPGADRKEMDRMRGRIRSATDAARRNGMTVLTEISLDRAHQAMEITLVR
jgi:hypothetical protein